METSNTSAFAGFALQVICRQEWVRERCLQDPQKLCSAELLLDPALSPNQVTGDSRLHKNCLLKLYFSHYVSFIAELRQCTKLVVFQWTVYYLHSSYIPIIFPGKKVATFDMLPGWCPIIIWWPSSVDLLQQRHGVRTRSRQKDPTGQQSRVQLVTSSSVDGSCYR